jgi:hypothetical protein
VSLTLSARGNLVSFSQPVNVATAAFNVFALKAAVHGTQALNMGVHALPMDDEGNRWGFQLSGASVQHMLSEHCDRACVRSGTSWCRCWNPVTQTVVGEHVLLLETPDGARVRLERFDEVRV